MSWLLDQARQYCQEDFKNFLYYRKVEGSSALTYSVYQDLDIPEERREVNFKMLFPMFPVQDQMHAFLRAVDCSRVKIVKWFPIERIPDSDLLKGIGKSASNVAEYARSSFMVEYQSQAREIQDYLLQEAGKRGLDVPSELLNDVQDSMSE